MEPVGSWTPCQFQLANWTIEEPAAAWGPCQFQLANWTAEEQSAVWGPRQFQMSNWNAEEPAAGLPTQYASIDIPVSGTCCLQAYVPESSGGQRQLVEYYAAATTQNDTNETEAQESFEVSLRKMEMEIYHHVSPFHVFQEVVRDFENGIDRMKMMMHRYPATIQGLGDWYTVPSILAIGPYHHGRQHLKHLEQVKHVAAYHCILESDHSLQEVYDAVVSAAHHARGLYSKDAMAGIGDRDFLPMMFFDACFLVQYMLWYTHGEKEMDPSLRSFFDLNEKVLRNDVMLLENQLPWQVVEAVMRFRHVSVKQFVASLRGILQHRKDFKKKHFVFDDRYKPPHLLGILRHHIVGSKKVPEVPDVVNIEGVSLSVSAIELAEIGIKLRANETAQIINMGLKKQKGFFFAELSLAPLSLTHARASWLVNMAALELCTTPKFLDAKDEDSAVCSYLHLLSMLVHREEDVQELRKRGILQGAGLTNKEALEFFTSFQSVPRGSYCVYTMLEIESYRVNRWIRTKVHAFIHKKKKTIITVLSTIVAVVSIFGTLIGILVKLKSVKAAS